MRIFAFFSSSISLLSLLPTTSAVFADEAFHTDYHHALLGTPQKHTTFFHRPSPASNASLLYTLSEKLILGAVNPRDGAVVWRQDVGTLAGVGGSKETVEGFLRPVVGGDVVVGAAGGLVAAWDGTTGRAVWEHWFEGLEGPVVDMEILELEDGADDSVVGGRARDAVVLGGESKGLVRRIDGRSGAVKWEFKDESGDIPFQVLSSATTIYYISLHSALLGGYKIRVTALDPLSGRQTTQLTLSAESEVSSPESILFVGANTASPLLAWTDKSYKTVKVNVIGSKHINTLSVENTSGEEIEGIRLLAPDHAPSQPHFLVHYRTSTKGWAEVYHTDLKSATVSKEYKLPRIQEKDLFTVSTRDANVYFTRISDSEVSLVSSASHGVLGRWPRKNATSEGGIHGVAEVVAKPDKSFAVRFVQTLSSGDWELVLNGIPAWTRPESLAGAVVAEWAEPKIQEGLAHELNVEGHQNVIQAYIHRVKRHARDLQGFPGWIQALPLRIMTSFVSNEATSQDAFGLNKLVATTTSLFSPKAS